MAPVEFEKKLQKALSSRKIQPGKAAWERLESRLEAEKLGRRQSKSYRLLLVAASLLVLIGLPVYLGMFSKNAPEAVVVENPVEKTKREQPQKAAEGLTEDTYSKGLVSVPREADPAAEVKQSVPGPTQIKEHPNALAFEGVPPAEPLPKVAVDPAGLNSLDALVAQQVDAVLSRVAGMEAASGEVSDAEIDSLLREAQALISMERQKSSGSIDAMALLSEAEAEMDQTFREQLFSRLKQGFNKVRTAVADRNK